MDFTTVGWLIAISITGYILVGVIVGAIISNAVFNDGASITDARTFGGISVVVWPLALVVLMGAALWYFVLMRALTPRKHREKVRKERAEREAQGLPAPGYVD